MKIAILSDIHGNTIALDAVLADIDARGGVDGYWVAGDLTALGPDPVGVVERCRALPNVEIIFGNADYYTTSGNYPAPHIAQVEADNALIQQYGEVQRSFAWTCGALSQGGQRQFVANLPQAYRTTLPDGTRVLMEHASPGQFDGQGFRMDHADAALLERLAGTDAHLFIGGHVHWPFNRLLGDTHVVVTGGIGNQFAHDLRAKYVVLDTNADDYTITFHAVEYDYAAAIEAIIDAGHSSAEFLLLFARGHYRSRIQARLSSAEIIANLPEYNKPYHRGDL